LGVKLYEMRDMGATAASQVRTTSRSWDKGVLTDLCLTRVLTDLCLTLYNLYVDATVVLARHVW